jgi:hypothetical protein
MSVLASTAALVIALAAAPTPTPFPIGSLEPFGSSTPVLPEIGRTRAARPACAAMRDLVIPSFAAARRADERFVQTRKRLPQYADLVDDTLHQPGIYRETAIARLDGDATALLNETLVINRALGDPRLSEKSTDPQILAVRAQLQQLYDAQQMRANLLTEFAMRERVATGTLGLGDNSGLATRQNSMATPTPAPRVTAPPNMPVLLGNSLTDKRALDDWGKELSYIVRTSENRAAKTFLPIAQGCR